MNNEITAAIDRITKGRPHAIRDMYLSGNLTGAAKLSAQYGFWGVWNKIQTEAGATTNQTDYMRDAMGLDAMGKKIRKG